jgi:Carboxypeptidase regulatory-like domain
VRTLKQLIFVVLCSGLCVVLCSGQEVLISPGTGTPAQNGATSVVQGKVVQDPGGQGLRKVKVTLTGGRREHYGAITDETGQFTIEGVEPGGYFVELERSGYASKTHKNLTVIAGQDNKDLVYHMLAAGVISGRILDLDGDPLQSVGVMATPSGDGPGRRNLPRLGNASTNDLGEYRIADLPPGKYLVRATPSENQVPPQNPSEQGATKDRVAYVTTYFPGTVDDHQAITVEVLAGGTATASFGVQTSRVYRVSGIVSGLNGTPATPTPPTNENWAAALAGQAMGQIVLFGENGQTQQQNLSEGGKFEFSGVLPGTYHARLIVFSGLLSGQPPSVKLQTISTPIEVNSSDVVGLQLQVDPGSNISGGFRADKDEQIDWKQLYVGFSPATPHSEENPIATGMVMPVRLNEDGSFEVKDVPEGNWQLVVTAHSDKFRDYYTKSVLLGGREVADTGFVAAPGTVLDVVISAKGAAIEGTVVDQDGKPVVEATVVIVPSSGKLGRPDAYQVGATDQSGHFLLRGINPGEFLVLAFDELRDNYRTPEFVKKYEGKGEKAELDEGAKKSVVLKVITEGEGGQ